MHVILKPPSLVCLRVSLFQSNEMKKPLIASLLLVVMSFAPSSVLYGYALISLQPFHPSFGLKVWLLAPRTSSRNS